MAKQEYREVKGTVSSFVSDAYSAVVELRDEIQSWKDNLPENLQQGQKGEELDACLEALQNCDFPPDVPEEHAELEVIAREALPKKSWGRTYISRRTRLDNALALLSAAIAELEEKESDASELFQEHYDEFDGADFPRMM